MLINSIPKGSGTIWGFIVLGAIGLAHAWFPDIVSDQVWASAATMVGMFTGVRLRQAVK